MVRCVLLQCSRQKMIFLLKHIVAENMMQAKGNRGRDGLCQWLSDLKDKFTKKIKNVIVIC